MLFAITTEISASAGETDDARLLHVTFTMRGDGTLIRVISARDMHRKERTIYEQIKNHT